MAHEVGVEDSRVREVHPALPAEVAGLVLVALAVCVEGEAADEGHAAFVTVERPVLVKVAWVKEICEKMEGRSN